MKKSNLNRRSFLKSSSITGGGLLLSFSWFAKARAAEKLVNPNITELWNELNGYIKIMPNNVIKIICPNPEFGQNVMTSLPMMVAEELDCDWKNVVVEMGVHDSVKLGPQFTGGSNSIRMYWKPLRNAGASARQMLIEAADAGFYQSFAGSMKFPKMQILTIEELLSGKEIKMPPRVHHNFKPAQRTSQNIKQSQPNLYE